MLNIYPRLLGRIQVPGVSLITKQPGFPTPTTRLVTPRTSGSADLRGRNRDTRLRQGGIFIFTIYHLLDDFFTAGVLIWASFVSPPCEASVRSVAGRAIPVS